MESGAEAKEEEEENNEASRPPHNVIDLVEDEEDVIPISPPLASRDAIARYFIRHAEFLPGPHYTSMDSSRMTLLFFALGGLDILGALEEYVETNNRRSLIIEWIYAQQLEPSSAHPNNGGFRGAPDIPSSSPSVTASLPQTYVALGLLLMLGDNLDRVNKSAVYSLLKSLRTPSGSFYSSPLNQTEYDLRHLFCAVATSVLLGLQWPEEWVSRTVEYINKCSSYDGAFGLEPDREGHGGSTYVAVASLSLLNQLSSLSPTRLSSLKRWCLFSQGKLGYHGRPNKPSDSCYSFWIGATLDTLGVLEQTDVKGNFSHLCRCWDQKRSGWSKEEGNYADILHSYMSLAGLALIQKEKKRRDEERKGSEPNELLLGLEDLNLCPLESRLNLTVRALKNGTTTKGIT